MTGFYLLVMMEAILRQATAVIVKKRKLSRRLTRMTQIKTGDWKAQAHSKRFKILHLL